MLCECVLRTSFESVDETYFTDRTFESPGASPVTARKTVDRGSTRSACLFVGRDSACG